MLLGLRLAISIQMLTVIVTVVLRMLWHLRFVPKCLRIMSLGMHRSTSRNVLFLQSAGPFWPGSGAVRTGRVISAWGQNQL